MSPDPRLIGGGGGEGEEAVELRVSVKPFVKHPPNLPFFVVPVISSVLFPQFKSPKSPGVLRAKGRKGSFLIFCSIFLPEPDDAIGRVSLNPSECWGSTSHIFSC